MSLVYVLNEDGAPLMPCRPVVARLLLKEDKVQVKYRTPFTIQLTSQIPEPYTQDLELGIDSGSSQVGSAVFARDTGDVLYLSQIELRNDITHKMDRRTRRGRKTRYRPPRFLNRASTRREGRLSPTVQSKLAGHQRELRFVQHLLPVNEHRIRVETASFDIHALSNPQVYQNPQLYQQGLQYGFENTKAYVLTRDQHTCQICKGKRGVKEHHCHHIIFREAGGSDHPDNLIALCKACHNDLHTGKLELKQIGRKKRLAPATQMNVLRSQLLKSIPGEETFGYITKTHRYALGLPKTHYIDASIIASRGKTLRFKQTTILYKKCVAAGDYQQTKGRRSEQSIPTGKLGGFRKFDQVRYGGGTYIIKGRMASGYAILMDIHGTKVTLGHIPKLRGMKRLRARKSWLMTVEPLIIEDGTQG